MKTYTTEELDQLIEDCGAIISEGRSTIVAKLLIDEIEKGVLYLASVDHEKTGYYARMVKGLKDAIPEEKPTPQPTVQTVIRIDETASIGDVVGINIGTIHTSFAPPSRDRDIGVVVGDVIKGGRKIVQGGGSTYVESMNSVPVETGWSNPSPKAEEAQRVSAAISLFFGAVQPIIQGNLTFTSPTTATVVGRIVMGMPFTKTVAKQYFTVETKTTGIEVSFQGKSLLVTDRVTFKCTDGEILFRTN